MSLKKQIPIIFENTHYFIVNKPPGIPSQPPDCRTWGRTHPNLDPTPLLERFKAIYYSHREVELCRTVHRLDHCVTGGMLIAKTKDASVKFSRFLQKGGNNGYKLQRKYVAIVESSGRFNKPNNYEIKYGPKYNFLISHGGRAVSYTHLDVYKRQELKGAAEPSYSKILTCLETHTTTKIRDTNSLIPHGTAYYLYSSTVYLFICSFVVNRKVNNDNIKSLFQNLTIN